uniref:Uncharacterized protein n=1 Tax=Arundo donax TaxID=35708 RepID=A0A0A9HSZ8_ARUDO
MFCPTRLLELPRDSPSHHLACVAEPRDLPDPDGSISVTGVERASICTPAQA